MKIYSEEEIKKLDIEYNNLMPVEGIIWEDFAKKVNSINHKDKIYFQRKMVDDALNQYCAGYYIYPEKDNDLCSGLKKIILNTVEHFPKEYYFWWCVYYYFLGDKKNLEKNLRDFLIVFDENNFNEYIFVQCFLDLYKNAYSGFWKKLSDHFKKLKNTKAENLCNLFEDFYYNCKTYSEKENLFVNYIQKNPETILAKEFLGFIYGDMKLYYNGIQCLEQVKDKSNFFYYEDIYFQLAWYYGKVKEYSSEEENYRKCLEMNYEYMYALNNLGWSLYKQRKFDEAEKVFLKCIEENRDLPFPTNNLVRIYIKTKQIEKAKKIIESKKFKVSKTLVEKIKKYSINNNYIYDENESDDEETTENKKIIKNDEYAKQQFSSEKILEDELVSRIESGNEVFGLKLKIYRRKNDYYGRQYPYNDGKNNRRLDILCEDEQENLYIVELKKDSGYSDAYQQIKNYVDYFEKNRVSKGKKVFGIICLNSPTEKLLNDVRQDNRIRLFEYKISYNELF